MWWRWSGSHAQISECGVETRLLAKHQCNASDLAFEPGSPHLIYTCGEDGLVQHVSCHYFLLKFFHGVKTRMVANHIAGAYDLAVEPGSPHIFYSCGTDGPVNHIDLRTAAATKLFKFQSIDDCRLDFTPLFHMAIDPMNSNIFAVAGSDKHTLLYDIRKSKRDGSTDFGQPIDLFYPLV
ncbi:hypothetical protein V6N13_122081 [Hibiscus sabdariffa]